eukprot:403373708
MFTIILSNFIEEVFELYLGVKLFCEPEITISNLLNIQFVDNFLIIFQDFKIKRSFDNVDIQNFEVID